MSLTDRLAELYELLAGLGVAAAVIACIAWFIGMTGSGNRRGDGAKPQPLSRAPLSGTEPNEDRELPALDQSAGAKPAPAEVAALYIAPTAGTQMERADRADAVAGRGLVGDRYFLERGHWSGTDECEVTIIAQEDIDEIERRSNVRIQDGEHRRNVVIRNLPIENLIGKRFHIGSASFGYERPRPPCAYIQMVSQPGMTKALGKRAGICVRCIKSGVVQEGDRIVIQNITLLQALNYRTRVALRQWQSRKKGHDATD
jgi:MOSC domain-containing protein YiiM